MIVSKGVDSDGDLKGSVKLMVDADSAIRRCAEAWRVVERTQVHDCVQGAVQRERCCSARRWERQSAECEVSPADWAAGGRRTGLRRAATQERRLFQSRAYEGFRVVDRAAQLVRRPRLEANCQLPRQHIAIARLVVAARQQVKEHAHRHLPPQRLAAALHPHRAGACHGRRKRQEVLYHLARHEW